MLLLFITVLYFLTTSGFAAPSMNYFTKIQTTVTPRTTGLTGYIACNETGERIFIVNNDYMGDGVTNHTIESYSFDGTTIAYVTGVQLIDWIPVDIQCNTNGTKIFLAVQGANAYVDYDGVLALDYDGAAFSVYSITASYDANDAIDSIAYNEQDDVVFSSEEDNCIGVYKNNGSAYEFIDHFGTGNYDGVAYNNDDGNVYTFSTGLDGIYCFGWNNSNNTAWWRAESDAFAAGTTVKSIISGAVGTVATIRNSGDPDACIWVSAYDGDDSMDDDFDIGDNVDSYGLCWVGRSYGAVAYFALAQGCYYDDHDSEGLVLCNVTPYIGFPVPYLAEIDSYDDGAFFYDAAYTDNNFDKSVTINGFLFAIAVEYSGTGTQGHIYVFTIDNINDPPYFLNPDPEDGAIEIPTTLEYWNITINDVHGDDFNYTIECSNGDTTSASYVNNGTYSLAITDLSSSTTYTVWVNATDQNGSGAWNNETFSFTTDVKTRIDHFLIKTEQGANVGWDLDNDNVTLDITFHDAEGDTTYLYFTFNLGSQARVPTTGDYDATYNAGVNATITDYDLTWTAGSWVDYYGVIYVRVVGWDGGNYTPDLTYSTLAGGIDGTTPSSSVDDIPGYNRSYSPLAITATATDSPSAATIYNVSLYYSYSSDNSSWSAWMLFQIDYSSPYSWSFTFQEGAGWYKFGTRALDLAGNLEDQATDDTIYYDAAFEHESGIDLVERGLGVAVGDLILFILTCSLIVVAAVDVRIAAMFATLLYSVLFVIYYEATAAGYTGYDPVRVGICVAICIVILALLILAAGKSKSRQGYIP